MVGALNNFPGTQEEDYAVESMNSYQIAQVRLGGEFDDAFIYMGNIFATTPEGQVLAANLEELIESASRSNYNLDLFVRNDRLSQDIIGPLSSVPILSPKNKPNVFSPRVLEIDFDDAGWSVAHDLSETVNCLTSLDILAYYERLYIGSDRGVFSAEIRSEMPSGSILGKVSKRLDTSCLALSSRGGAVTASCGANGVFFALDEVGMLTPREEYASELVNMTSLPSSRVSWLGLHMVSHEGASSVTSHRSTYKKVANVASSASKFQAGDTDSEELPKFVITGLNPDEGLILPELDSPEEEKVSYRDNWHNIFFSWHEGGQFDLHEREWSDGKLGEITSSVKGACGRPVSTAHHPGGVVVEESDRVMLYLSDDKFAISDSECLSVRTFPNSRWYRNIIVTIDDDSLSITSPYLS